MSTLIKNIPNPAIYSAGIKLICFDLDGTLVNAKGNVGELTLSEIKRVKEKYGITIAFATGRPLFASDALIDQVGARGASMFYAGAFIVDVETRIPAFECHLSQKELKEILNFARTNKLTLELYTGEEYFVDEMTELTRIHADDYLHVKPQIMDLGKLIEREKFLKAVIMRGCDAATDHLLPTLFTKLKDSVVSYATGAKHPDIYFHNITNAYASRKQAFQALLEQHRVRPEQVMAFGDSPSDQEFLRLSGVGIAMGNASQLVKESANLIAKHVEEDGVGDALKQIFD